MSATDITHFASALSALGLRETDLAVAMLWYTVYQDSTASKTASELAAMLHQHTLTSGVNRTRLHDKLKKHPDTASDARTKTFRILLSSKPQLDSKYLPLLRKRKVVVTHAFLPESQTMGSRTYIEKLAWQLNGCYESGFYDACAVLCRRLVESLLIEVFDKAGKSGAIQNGTDYKQLGDIIGIARSGKHIKLARGIGDALDDIKKVGDTAAHDRYYITTIQDMQNIEKEFRRTIAHLMALAKISHGP